MITEREIHGGWNELKGKVKQAWGEINDDDLRALEGDVQQLIGLIERQTGEARGVIEERLQELDERFHPYFASAVRHARQYAEDTAAGASEQVERMKESLSASHDEAQKMVQRRPLESVAVAFGAGMIAGVVLGLVARTR